MYANFSFSQITENFDSGIPSTWAIRSNLPTPPINNNWISTTTGYGGGSSKAASVNPALNSTGGTNAQYFLISPQLVTPTNGEIRFYTRQGSFSNYGTTYQLKVSTASQPDISSFNVTLGTWTESQLNVTATTYEEKIVPITTIPAGIPIYLAFVAVTNQIGSPASSATKGDTWYIDNFRLIGSCSPVTSINTSIAADNATISWTHPTATSFGIEVVPSGAGHGATGTPVTGTTFTATGLTPLTTYDVYIITNCDATTSSTWAGPFSFTTAAIGLTCSTAIQVPSDVTVNPYVYSNNLNQFYDGSTYVDYNSQTLSCQPPNTPSTWNLLSGNHAYFSFTPSTTGLVNISQAVSSAAGGGGTNCYNTSSSLFVFNGCTGVGTSAACLAGVMTGTNVLTAQLNNFYVQSGQTYIILISAPYAHTNPGAGICFTLTISGSTCPAPATITYSNLQQTSVNTSWSNVQNLVNAWEYIAYPITSGTPSASQAGTPTTTNVNNPVTGLLAGTAYNLFVRAVCSGAPGPWSAPMLFTTLCNQLPLPYYTGFTTANAANPEPCWTILNLNNDQYKFKFGNSGNSEPVAQLRTGDAAPNDMLITPQFHFDGVTQKRLRFKYNIYGNWGLIVNNPTGGPGSFEVSLSTTGVGESNFTTILAPLASYTTAYNFIEMILPIPANIVGDINIAWKLPPGSVQTGVQFYIDDVYVEDMPACSDPIYPAVTASSITSTSAQLTWTNGYNTSQWEIIAQPQGIGMPAASASGTIVNTNPYTFTGLIPSTQYEFWVRSYCNSTNQSNWVGPVKFFTTCIAQPTPYYESFNDDDITSKKFCWTVQNRNSDSAKWIFNATNTEITPYSVNAFTPLSSFDDFLVSVPLNMVGQKRLRYKYKAATDIFYPTPRGVMEVLVSNDPNFVTYTTLIPEYEFTNNAYIENSVIFNGTGFSYIAFRIPPTMTNPASSTHVFIDDVYVEDAPACQVPSNLTSSGTSTTTANLSWTTGYLETQWEVVVQAAGSGIPNVSGYVVNTNPAYSVTGLTSDTAYECYVRAVCDATNSSTWVGPFKFRTKCNPLPTPFLETFDSNSPTETCWTIVNQNGDSKYWNLNQTVNPIFGNEMASMFSGSNGNNNDWLITPTLTAHAGQRLRFFYKTYMSDFEEDIRILLSTNGTATNQFTTLLYQNTLLTTTDATGTVMGSNTITVTSVEDIRVGDMLHIMNNPIPYHVTVTNISGNVLTLAAAATATVAGPLNVDVVHETINNTTPREMVINLTNITTPTNVNIAFNTPFFPPNPWAYRGQYTFIDNVIVEDIPVCPNVTNVTVVSSNLQDTSAQINWDVVGTENSWEISLQPYGTAAPVGATLPSYLITTTTHPYTFTGLTPGMKYQFYVRALCSSASQSVWVGPFEFTTKCDLTNVCQYTISVTNGSTGKVTRTVDVMQNGQVVQSLNFPGYGQPTTIDYTVFLCKGVQFDLYWNAIGSGVQYSQAQMVVRDESNTIVWTSPLGLGTPYTNIYTGFAACGTITCPQPSNLTSSNQGNLSWTPGGTETQWEVYIQPLGNGTLPQSGQIVNTPSYTPLASDFVDATAGTYEYFVRALCSSSNTSFWSGPQKFIRNDESANSINLVVNTGTSCEVSAVNASFIGATASSNPTSCSGVNGGDIWYDFIATSKVHTIELSEFTPGNYYASSFQGPWPKIIMSLYEVQTDGSLIEKGCSENNSFVTMYSSELVVGSTYKIRLKLNDTFVNRKLFHICITIPVSCDMNAFNYDFEKLPMQYVTGVPTIITTTVIPGWRTNTDTNQMFFNEASNSPGVVPYSGGQCLQLIQDSATLWNPLDPYIKGLYKDFDTSEIIQMDYSFASASRTATGTTVQLFAGPPLGPFTLITEDTASSLSWNLVQGNYMVPTGQSTTRFIFRVKNYNLGHLLDAANFKPNTDIITANTTLPCATTSMLLEAQGIGQWVADATNPATIIIATPNIKSTTISGFNTPGNYIFHWKTRYCDKTITITYLGISEAPVVVNPQQFCINETPFPLSASLTATYSPRWYSEAVGGVSSTTAPTPSTLVVGNSQVYYVSASDGNGCEGPRSQIVVQINPLPTITGTFTACVGSTSQLLGSDSAATNNAWISSNTAVATISTTGLVTGISEGTTTITYSNDKGCKESVTITINALPTITGNLSVCVGGETQLTGTTTAATTNAWTSSNTAVATISATGLVTGVASGSTTITYTNSNGCQITASVTINELPVITGTLSACVGSTTQLSGTATAATTNAWASSNTAVATISTTGLVTGVAAGTSTITYSNSNGCQTTASVTINELPTITGTLSTCVGSTTQLSGTTTAATTTAWASSNTAVATISATGLVTGVTSGSTTITYTNSNGCQTTANVNINSLPTITGTLSACVGSTTQLSGNATAATINAWASSNTAVATISATGLVTGVASGTTTIIYTNSDGCQVSATVTINALPTISGNLSACVGSTTQLSGTANAATTSAWASSNTAVATISATGLVTGVSYGTTTITYTNSNGCQITASITINELPLITGTLSACVGSTTQLSGTATAATSNAWITSNSAVATISTTGLVTGVAAGTTTITYTNSNGCQTTASVTINALPTITGTLSACVGSTTQLSGTTTSATTNAWISSNTAVATISATGLVTGVASGSTTITYTNSNGCQTTASVTINALPTITGTLSACVGSTAQLSGTGIAATSNAWTSSNNAVATVSNAGLITGVASGNTIFTYTNSNGCQSTATVTINALPTITGTLNACVGSTTQLTGTSTAATTTAWVSSNTAVATINTTGLVTGVASGTTTIIYTNSDGCQVSATVTINALPTISGTLSACVGNTTQLTGNGTAIITNAWTSSNTVVATVDSAGLVTGVLEGTSLITYNNDGCQITATVTINALPTITGTLNACVGSTTQLTGTSTSATTTAWVSSNTAVATISATGLVTGVASGSTTITYTNSNGCQTSANVTINELPTITGTLNACVGSTTQLTGTAIAATTNAWISSNTAVITISGTGIVTGVAAGTSTITYTNSNGCQTNATVTINPLTIPNVNFSYAQVCINSATSPLPILTTNFVNGGVFSSSTLNVNASTGAVNLNTATTGSHQITYTLAQNTANCTAAGVYSASIVITAGLTPVTTFNYNSINCANATNQLPVTAFEFYTGGVYSSTNGLSINSNTGEINFVQSTPGNYTITYTVQPNQSNCNSGGSSSISISILNPLNYSIDVICQGQSLELQVVPTNNSFNVNDVNYSWTNSTNNPIGTNNAVFNVEDYLNQNPNLNLPQTFNVSVRLNGCFYSSNITVTNNSCKIIPRGISPNNDQVNDAFDLTGLGVTELSIYNRYGTKVYSFNGNYSNQWSGLSNDGNDLPDGTYFYSIQKGDNTNVTGWVYINRQY